MKYILKSPYPCLVKTADAQSELDKNDSLEIEDEKFVFIYPQDARKEAFCINLSSPKDCEKYSFFSRDGMKYIVLENTPNFQVQNKEKLNFSGKIVEISVGDNEICFETSSKKIVCHCESANRDFSCFKIQNFACVQFENELFLFSVKEQKVFHFSGEIEIDGNQISVTKKFFDSENREKKSVFVIKDEIELENEEFVSTPHKKETSDGNLFPFKFMESISAKDYACAMNFLSDKLRSQIEVSQLGVFFDNFTAFLPVSTTEFITINGKNKKFVQFSMDGEKVNDISVDDL